MNPEQSSSTVEREKRRDQAKERVRQTLDKRIRSVERSPETTAEFFPKVTVEGDSDSIENHQIDIIDEPDKIAISFKLVERKWLELIDKLKGSIEWSEDQIVYSGHSFNYSLCKAYRIKSVFDDFKIYVAKNESYNNIRASFGLVKIELSRVKEQSEGQIKTGEQLIQELETIMSELLDIKDALQTPDEKAEKEYKLARYNWSHKLPAEHQITEEQEKELLAKLSRQEVLPGYSTIIEEGRAEKIEKMGPFFLFHHIYSSSSPEVGNNIMKMYRNGLISTHERYRRGLKISGSSSDDDLLSGGADGVFVRMHADSEISPNLNYSVFGAELIFKKSILDRLDYYCYDQDRYGRTSKDTFQYRATPEQLLDRQLKGGTLSSNEMIFRQGISFRDVEFIAVESAEIKDNILKSFIEANITEINGVLIDDFIKIAPKRVDVIKLTNPEMVEKLSKLEAEAGEQRRLSEAKKLEEVASIKLKTIEHLKEKFKVGQTVGVLVLGNIIEANIEQIDDKLNAKLSASDGSTLIDIPLTFLVEGSKILKVGDIVSPIANIDGFSCVAEGSKWKIIHIKAEGNSIKAEAFDVNNSSHVHSLSISGLALAGQEDKVEQQKPLKFKVGDIVVGNSLANNYAYTKEGVRGEVLKVQFSEEDGVEYIMFKIIDGPEEVGSAFWVQSSEFDLVNKE